MLKIVIKVTVKLVFTAYFNFTQPRTQVLSTTFSTILEKQGWLLTIFGLLPTVEQQKDSTEIAQEEHSFHFLISERHFVSTEKQ